MIVKVLTSVISSVFRTLFYRTSTALLLLFAILAILFLATTVNAYESQNVDLFTWYGDGITGGYIKCDNVILSSQDLETCNDILDNFVTATFLYATSTTGDNDTATGAGQPFPILDKMQSPLGNQINLGNVNGYPIPDAPYDDFYTIGDGENNTEPPATTSTTTVIVNSPDYTNHLNYIYFFLTLTSFIVVSYTAYKTTKLFL